MDELHRDDVNADSEVHDLHAYVLDETPFYGEVA